MSPEPVDPNGASAPPPASGAAGLGDWGAGALVFGANAAVLVVELVALRLLAPYLGLTLETSTLVIGLALAAIALGSWLGGRWADRVDPRAVLAPLLAVSAVAVAATPFAVRAAGADAGGSGGLGGALLLPVSAATIMVPGALLSAVTPMVTKLALTTLTQTGTIVGRLSGIGTAGAIAGTILTGFVLISRVSVTGIMVGLGVALLLAAVATWLLVGRAAGPGRGRRQIAGGAICALLLGAATLVTPSGCDAETTYHCAAVVDDPARAGGRTLVLDGLRHSYVDVDDPTHLSFAYVRSMAAAIDAHRPGEQPLRVHNIGAGGLTLPRYLSHTRPGTGGTVSEIDGGVVRIDAEKLALPTDLGFDIRVEDGRRGLRALPDTAYDVVIGDAFGGVSVPWHLATAQAVAAVDRILADDGVYALNVIDYPPLDFARAEVATVRSVFGHVAVAAAPATVTGRGGGNLVVLASRSPLHTADWLAGMRERDLDWLVVQGAALDEWLDNAALLTDDYAPVDQLLTPYPPAVRAA